MRKPKLIIDDITSMGKLPPQALDFEEIVLGAVMLEQSAYDRIALTVNSNDFYSEQNKLTFQAIEELSKNNEPINFVTVTKKAKELGTLELIGGAYYITTLTNRVASTANIEYNATVIKQKSTHRRFIQALAEAQQNAWNETLDIYDLIRSTGNEIDNLTLTKSKNDIIQIGTTAAKVYLDTENAKNNPSETVGLKSCIREINEKLMGYSAPDLIIVAARPGEGKSTLALQEALFIAEQGNPVLFFSMEMKDKQLVWKVLSQKTEIEVLRIRSGNISDTELTDIAYQSQSLKNVPLYFADGINNLADIKSVSRQSVKQKGIKFIVVDYLGLISHSVEGGTREQVVSEISRQLKQLCLELNVPIMLLSQLSRPTKGVSVKPPQLHDLKESGAIEANADGVIFIFRPEYHGVYNVDGFDEHFNENMAIIDVAKQRLGNTGKFLTAWNGKYNRFENDKITEFKF